MKAIYKSKKSLSTGVCNYLIEKHKCEILNDRVLKLSGKTNDKIEDKISYWEQWIKIYKSLGFLALKIIIHEFFNGKYIKYSSGLESVAKDIFIVFKNLIFKSEKEIEEKTNE